MGELVGNLSPSKSKELDHSVKFFYLLETPHGGSAVVRFGGHKIHISVSTLLTIPGFMWIFFIYLFCYDGPAVLPHILSFPQQLLVLL